MNAHRPLAARIAALGLAACLFACVATAGSSGTAPAAPAGQPSPAAGGEQAPRLLYAAAALAGGSCDFSDCLRHGWTVRGDTGSVTSACRFGDCLKHGWSTSYPGGATATTSCSFDDCMRHGWTTRWSGGGSAQTSCSFDNCWKHGWTTRFPDGTSATTDCSFSDCRVHGWTTRLAHGSLSCSCRFGDCARNGADCR